MEALMFELSSGSVEYYETKEIPTLQKENDVLVKVAYSGVCGTDIHIIKGEFPCNDKKQFTMGHEFCGTVVKIGPAARFKLGQRVVIDPNSGCGVCLNCHSGKYHLCSQGGILSTLGIWRNGGWANYCVVPDTQVFVLPDEISFTQAALCEPLSCLAHGWDRVGHIPVGEDVLVMGAGIVGSLWASLLHLQGHRNVTISEPNTTRLKMAKDMNLGFFYDAPANLKSSGKMFDVIIDCTGVAMAMEDSMPFLKPSGRYVIFGCCNPKDYARISPFQMYLRETSIIAVNINPFTFPKAIGFLQSMGERYISYEKLGIKVFPLSKFAEAFRDLEMGKISKAVFKLE